LKAASRRAEAMTPHDFVQRHIADVVPMACVFRARISQTNEEPHRSV
jgi:hypothetical protein